MAHCAVCPVVIGQSTFYFGIGVSTTIGKPLLQQFVTILADRHKQKKKKTMWKCLAPSFNILLNVQSFY